MIINPVEVTVMDQITVGNVKWVAGSDESFTELASSFAAPLPLALYCGSVLGFFLDPKSSCTRQLLSAVDTLI